MSTLRTDTLQTTDSTFTIAVNTLANAISLANNSNSALGAALVGYNGGTVATALSGIGNITADLANSSDPTKGAALVGYKGRTIASRMNDTVSALDYIPLAQHAAILNNTTNFDASSYLQAALDSGKRVYLPNGTYKFATGLLYKANGCGFIGESMSQTNLVYTGTSGNAIASNVSSTTTILFCILENLHLSATTIGGNTVVDWKSIQFGRINRVWFQGQSILGCLLLNMAANWTVTECTYNNVTECYFGNMGIGISLSDGANNNNFYSNRFQPSVSTAIGILLSATAAGRLSNINICGNGFEYPGAISTGLNILQNCDGVFVYGNRFEQMLNGMVVGATGNVRVSGVSRIENYFSSCTTNINLSTGATASRHALVAAAQMTSSVLVGNAFNLTTSNPSTGVYVFTYIDTTYPDANQVIQVTSTQAVNVVTQTSTGFTVTCQNTSLANTQSPSLAVSVFYNR